MRGCFTLVAAVFALGTVWAASEGVTAASIPLAIMSMLVVGLAITWRD